MRNTNDIGWNEFNEVRGITTAKDGVLLEGGKKPCKELETFDVKQCGLILIIGENNIDTKVLHMELI